MSFSSVATEASTLANYLPQETELNDWTPDDTPRIFKGDELFSLIDGGAAIYLEYGFKQAITQTYTDPQKHGIDLQIFEMSDAAAAYGIFTLTSGDSAAQIPVGDEGKLDGSYLSFRKGNFLVIFAGSDADQITLDALLSFAKSVDAKIQASGQPPLLIQLLPPQPFPPSPVKYIKGQMGLFNTTPFESGTFGDFAEGVVGAYHDVTVLILRYAAENDSENAAEMLKKNPQLTAFSLDAPQFLFMNDSGKHIAGRVFRNFLIIVVGTAQDQKSQICEQIVEKIKQAAH